jgi:hypothetical protein
MCRWVLRTTTVAHAKVNEWAKDGAKALGASIHLMSTLRFVSVRRRDEDPQRSVTIPRFVEGKESKSRTYSERLRIKKSTFCDKKEHSADKNGHN